MSPLTSMIEEMQANKLCHTNFKGLTNTGKAHKVGELIHAHVPLDGTPPDDDCIAYGYDKSANDKTWLSCVTGKHIYIYIYIYIIYTKMCTCMYIYIYIYMYVCIYIYIYIYIAPAKRVLSQTGTLFYLFCIAGNFTMCSVSEVLKGMFPWRAVYVYVMFVFFICFMFYVLCFPVFLFPIYFYFLCIFVFYVYVFIYVHPLDMIQKRSEKCAAASYALTPKPFILERRRGP